MTFEYLDYVNGVHLIDVNTTKWDRLFGDRNRVMKVSELDCLNYHKTKEPVLFCDGKIVEDDTWLYRFINEHKVPKEGRQLEIPFKD